MRGPTLVAGDVGVPDDPCVHKAPGLAEPMEKRGARLLCLPPDSPAFTPVGLASGQLEPFLRTPRARTRQALTDAVRAALNRIGEDDAQNGLHHYGYDVP